MRRQHGVSLILDKCISNPQCFVLLTIKYVGKLRRLLQCTETTDIIKPAFIYHAQRKQLIGQQDRQLKFPRISQNRVVRHVRIRIHPLISQNPDTPVPSHCIISTTPSSTGLCGQGSFQMLLWNSIKLNYEETCCCLLSFYPLFKINQSRQLVKPM